MHSIAMYQIMIVVCFSFVDICIYTFYLWVMIKANSLFVYSLCLHAYLPFDMACTWRHITDKRCHMRPPSLTNTILAWDGKIEEGTEIIFSCNILYKWVLSQYYLGVYYFRRWRLLIWWRYVVCCTLWLNLNNKISFHFFSLRISFNWKIFTYLILISHV